MVGGLLCDENMLTRALLMELVPEDSHACEDHNPENPNKLETLLNRGVRFVLFENRERIFIVDGDVTYLNIISEGLIKLFRDLKCETNDEKIKLSILIATRRDNTKKAETGVSGILGRDEYEQRLSEKLILAIGKEKLGGIEYRLEFADARYDKRLMLADIVCNTYLTRKSGKFAAQMEQVKRIFEHAGVKKYSVFENATVGTLARLLSENRIVEMMYQLCALPNLRAVNDLRNKLVGRLINLPGEELDAHLMSMSHQIGIMNNSHAYEAGIELAENYKSYILEELKKDNKLAKQVRFWTFDTDFYLLTMYDHLGAAAECIRYEKLCRENIGCINRSWEHIDYYFRFCIREANCMLGRFEFESVLERTDELREVFESARSLFGLIGKFEHTSGELKSELLGKTYGLKTETYANLMREKPELYEQAIAASDAAIAEFENAADLQRQYQYRCMIQAEHGDAEAALDSLMLAFPGEPTENSLKQLLNRIWSDKSKNSFGLYHYTNVMALLAAQNDPRAEEMMSAIGLNLADEIAMDEGKIHPWQMIFWNMGKTCYEQSKWKAADKYYTCAIHISSRNGRNVTMTSFSLSIAADWHLKGGMNEDEFRKIYDRFMKCDMPDSIRSHFDCEQDNKLDRKRIKNAAQGYLK